MGSDVTFPIAPRGGHRAMLSEISPKLKHHRIGEPFIHRCVAIRAFMRAHMDLAYPWRAGETPACFVLYI
jgi:hypothetical protein